MRPHIVQRFQLTFPVLCFNINNQHIVVSLQKFAELIARNIDECELRLSFRQTQHGLG
jgi:hypothetical protein